MASREEDGKKTIKSAMLYTISNVVSVIISIIIIPLLSNIMSTSDMGVATTFITTLGIVSYVCLFSIQTSINRAFFDYKDEIDNYISSIYIFSSISTIIVFVIYLLFHNFINSIIGFSTNLMCLMFIIILGLNGYYIMMEKWNFQNKYKNTFICTLLSSPIAQILSLVLVIVLVNGKYLGRIIGTQLFSTFFGIVFGILIIIKGKFTLKQKYINYGLRISIPLIPHLLSQTLLANLDLLMIGSMVGKSEAGIYSMAYTIGNVFFIVINQLLVPWTPWEYRRINNNEKDSIKSTSNIIVSIAALACVGLFTIAPELIHLFLNDSYSSSAYLIAPICAGMYFQIIYVLFYNIEYFHKKNIRIALFSIGACAINGLLNYFGIKFFGYQVAAYTTLISYLVLSLFHYFGMKMITKEKIYSEKYLLFVSLIIIITSIINVNFINNIILRYFQLIFVAVIIYIFQRKNIKNCTKIFYEFFNKKIQKD